MKFIDLFAGLGGFHIALSNLGHKCVFASEMDSELQEIYFKNFGIKPKGDIRKININIIPKHDILCAGFPCQPFSKAGFQRGFECPDYGDLFGYVLKVIKFRKPKIIFLENVPNLIKHDNGETWDKIFNKLESEGYQVRHKILSPHYYGIPQIRKRVYIVCTRKKLEDFEWPKIKPRTNLSIKSILDKNPKVIKPLADNKIKCLDLWQEFLYLIPKSDEIYSPLWAMEFGATYPYENETPYSIGFDELKKYKGSFGSKLKEVNKKNINQLLPSYAIYKVKKFPKWKIDYIKRSREFYKKHKIILDDWIPELLSFPQSFQKFEWNCKGDERIIWNNLIQFRASGIRVKRPMTSPALISMTTQQMPIIGWEKRHITFDECLKLQSMSSLKNLPESNTGKIRALGNAVNAKIVEIIADKVLAVCEG
jgi:DNA (cytosine-5)-methyltransferase 1